MIKFTLDVNKVIQMLREENKRILSSIKTGMYKAVRFFEADIIKQQMSGRRSPGFGLNRRTGALARSWFTTIKDVTGDYAISLATNVKYAAVHQYGFEKRNIPKRLYVIEQWDKTGQEFMSYYIVKQIQTDLPELNR